MTSNTPLPTAPGPPPGTRDIWFRRYPQLAVMASVAMFAGILLERLLRGNPADATSLLLVFPVTLLAATFGLRAGVAAGVFAVMVVVMWVTMLDVPLSPLGWLSRTLPVLLLGPLVGQAAERIAQAERERRQHEAAAVLHRRAIEVNDTLVQGMAAAKWLCEAGRQEEGLRTLDETIAHGHQLVSDLLREGGMGERSGTEAGALRPGP